MGLDMLHKDPFLSPSTVLNAALYVALSRKEEVESRLSAISRALAKPIGGEPEIGLMLRSHCVNLTTTTFTTY